MSCDSFNADFDRFDMTFSQTSNTSSRETQYVIRNTGRPYFEIRIDQDITIERTSTCSDSNMMALCALKCQRASVNLIYQNHLCRIFDKFIFMGSLIPN